MATKSKWRLPTLLSIALLCSPALAQAFDRASFDLLSGNQAKIGGVGLQWKWQGQWFAGGDAQSGSLLDASTARWREKSYQHIPDGTLTYPDLGLAAILRFQRNDRTGFYAEAGAGPRYLPDLYDSNGRRHGSRIALNSHAGIGFIWKNGIDLGFKAMHISNGNSAPDNDAVNAVGVGLRYRW